MFVTERIDETFKHGALVRQLVLLVEADLGQAVGARGPEPFCPIVTSSEIVANKGATARLHFAVCASVASPKHEVQNDRSRDSGHEEPKRLDAGATEPVPSHDSDGREPDHETQLPEATRQPEIPPKTKSVHNTKIRRR
jgi:hypothetical protein